MINDLVTVGAQMNIVTGVGSTILLFGLLYGYARLAFNKGKLVRHFAQSYIYLSLAYILRADYWDVLPMFMSEAAWEALRDQFGNKSINAIWNALAIAGAYHGLQALHLMIPERDRPFWSWLSAPLYPPWDLSRGVALCGRTVKRILTNFKRGDNDGQS